MPVAVHPALGDKSRLDWFVITFLAVLMILQALPYAWATVTLDTARDLSASTQIAQGDLVWRGPILNGLFHLGPIWFYLLAPVLWATKSQSLTLLWAGLLASTKFPLAYRLGAQFRDRELGLCMAAALALPGWSNLGSIFPTHTVMTEAAVLLQLLLMLKLAQGGSHRCWVWLGLAAGLALHAHPSACFVLILLPLVYWARASWPQVRELGAMSLGALLLVLPLLPMFWAESREGWPALAPTLDFAGDRSHSLSLSSSMSILAGSLLAGPKLALELGGSTALSGFMLGLMAVIAVFSVLGLVRLAFGHSLLPVVLLAGALLSIGLMLSWLRSYTPFYMALVLLPLFATLLALGMRELPWRRAWILVCLVPALVGSYVLINGANAGGARINVARLANVQNAVPKMVDAALLPAWQLDALGRQLCSAAVPVVLHGYLAVLYDSSLALGPEIRCRGKKAAAISGTGLDSAEHWLGLPPQIAQSMGLQQGAAWTDTPHRGVTPLWPVAAVPPADRAHYPHHQAIGTALAPLTWKVRSDAHNALIATDLLYPYRVNKVDKVLANGAPARQFAGANVTSVWVCDHCDASTIEWEVHGMGNDPDTLEIVAVALPVPAASGSRKQMLSLPRAPD